MSGRSFNGQALRTALLFMVVALQYLHGCDARSVRLPTLDIERQLEYHFHTYFDKNDPAQVSHAIKLRNGLVANCFAKKFIAIPQRYRYDPANPVLEHLNDTSSFSLRPVGPHPECQFETWVPVEYFSRAYEWFVQNRGPLTVFIHPLTPHEMADHTERIVFIGKTYNLKTNGMPEFIPNFKSQYEYLGLGFANPNNHNISKYFSN